MKKYTAFVLALIIISMTLTACSTTAKTEESVSDIPSTLESPITGEFTVVEKYIGYDGGVEKYHVLLHGEGYALSMRTTENVFAMLPVGTVCHGEMVLSGTLMNPYAHVLTLDIGKLAGHIWTLNID